MVAKLSLSSEGRRGGGPEGHEPVDGVLEAVHGHREAAPERPGRAGGGSPGSAGRRR